MFLKNLPFCNITELPSCPSCGLTPYHLRALGVRATYVATCDKCGHQSCGRCGDAPGFGSAFNIDTWGMNFAKCPKCHSAKLSRIGVLNGT
jgi:ribosomal protein L37AE/L43A